MSGMFNMDIDAFFKAQDLRMNEPEDGVDEILARSAQARGFPDPFNVSLEVPEDSTPSNSIRIKSNCEVLNDVPQLPSDTRNTSISGILAPSSSIRDKRVAVDDAPMYPAPVSPMHGTPPRGHASTSIRISPPPSMPQIAPDDNPPILKRKESPTKPDKPARKKAAIDAGLVPSSLKTASNHPPSKKFKSLDKLVPPTVKISPAPVPEVIDLSTLSPIEEPDFSVLVSRFEPAATSTQPMVAAAPSMFLEIKERVEKHAKMKRDKKLLRGASNTGSKVAGPSKARPSDISGDESSIIASSSRPSSPEPIRKPALGKSSAKPKPKPQPAAQAKLGPAKKGKKEKIKMLPHQFAQMLIDESKEPPDPAAQPKRKVHQFLKGKNIFYTGGDMTWASEKTMACMRLIMKHGGTLFPRFDSSLVTHVISEASRLPTLRALGIQKMKELPEHIPIVTWKWVVSGIDSGEPGELWEYAAFSERMPPLDLPARNPNAKGKQRAVADASADLSRISSFTQDKKQREKSIHDSDEEDDELAQQPAHCDPLPSPPSSPRNNQAASSSRVKIESTDDPLAEFYAQARADRDAAFARHGEAEEQDETDVEDAAVASDSDNEQKFTGPPPKRGWTADSKEAQRKNGPNEDIAKKLEELMLLHKAKPGMDDHWRAFSYQKCLRALRNYPKRIKTFNEARSIRGVGDKTALKIMEIIETGDLRRIGYENTADVQIRKVFQGIYGVGQTTAYKWYAAGCRSLDDLKAGKGGVTLTDAQKIGIEFYDDINDRMPREEAAALFDIIKPIALGIDSKLEIQIMGSFRRGKADCGDIDIMITRCPLDGKTHAGILHDLLEALHEAKIITEDLALPENSLDEEAIYRGLCHLPQAGSRRRRIDFLTVPWKSRGAALLYYTGDDIFNRAMRYKANRLGYSLNQKGLFAGVVRDPRNWSVKTNTGNIVASETEEEIFHMLGVPFQQPHERVRG